MSDIYTYFELYENDRLEKEAEEELRLENELEELGDELQDIHLELGENSKKIQNLDFQSDLDSVEKFAKLLELNNILIDNLLITLDKLEKLEKL